MFPLRGFPPELSQSLNVKDPCLDLLKVDEELLILKQKLTQKTKELKKDPKKKPVCRTGPDSSRNNLTPSGKKQESKRKY